MFNLSFSFNTSVQIVHCRAAVEIYFCGLYWQSSFNYGITFRFSEI